MPFPFKVKLEPQNPIPHVYPNDLRQPEMARNGYEVLSRAEPRDKFDPERRTISPPVYGEGPHITYDEEN